MPSIFGLLRDLIFLMSSIEDIKKIKSINNSNVEGIIVGKSIYDGDIKIKELAKEI